MSSGERRRPADELQEEEEEEEGDDSRWTVVRSGAGSISNEGSSKLVQS